MSAHDLNYDKFGTALRKATEAAGVVIVVLDGIYGSGISVQSEAERLAPAEVASILRAIADTIEADAQNIELGAREFYAAG